MYLVIRDKQIIAAHHELDIVEDYVSNQSSKDEMRILKLKKRKEAELESTSGFEDIYLVRYGEHYIPYRHYMVMKDLSEQRDYDLKYCRDVLFRLLEEDVVHNKKDLSAIKRVILLLEGEMEPLDDSDYDNLESLRKDFDDHCSNLEYLLQEED